MRRATSRQILALLILAAALRPAGAIAASNAAAELEEEQALSTEFRTPHTEWARPYAGGKLRVLFFANQAAGGGTLPREAVELMQRFDLEGAAVYWARIVDTTHEGWHGGAAGEARLRRLLEEPWDCFVFLGVSPDKVPLEPQYRLLEAVTKGAGLVLVGADDARVLKPANRLPLPRFLAEGVPLAGLPFARADTPEGNAAAQAGSPAIAARLLSVFGVKGGRGARLPARPEIEYRPGWETEYDYWQALVGRAMLWASRREPATLLSVLPPGARVERSSLPAGPSATRNGIVVPWQDAPGEQAPVLSVVLRGADGRVMPLATRRVEQESGRLSLTCPRLSAGRYYVDALLRGTRGVITWASGTFEVISARGVKEIALKQAWGEPGGKIEGQVSLSGPALPRERVRVDLCDRRGRVLLRQEGAPSLSLRLFSFPLPHWLPMLVRVRATLLSGRSEVASAGAWFNVTQRRRGQFNFLVWDVPGGTLGPYGEESLARLGMTLQLSRPAPPLHTQAYDIPWVPYTTRILNPLDAKGASEPCCWNDEAAIRKHVAGIVSERGPDRRTGVFVYSLGDEGVTRGACLDPACLTAFREYLRRQYASIDALNASWGSRYPGFEQVALDPPADNDGAAAKAQGNLPRWYDRQAFQCDSFTRLCSRFVQAFRGLDPKARVGFEGSGNFDRGEDYDAIVRTNGFWAPYPGLGDEVIRSIAPRDFPRANWMGYTKDADTLLSKYWRMVTRGCDSVWWWRWDGIGRFHGLLAPNLAPYAATRELVRDTQVVRDGLGDLLLRANMQHDGIGFVYSMPSAYAVQVAPGPAYGSYSAAHEAWSRNVRELGLQYRYLTNAMLARGELNPAEFKVLVLSRMEAISPAEAAVLRRFVGNGGCLVADIRPGVYDGHCKLLQQGALDDLFGIRRADAGAAPVQGDAELGEGDTRLRLPKILCDPGVALAGGTAGGRCGQVPLLIAHRFGKGRALLLNFSMDSFPGLRQSASPRAADGFLSGLFAILGVRPQVGVLDAAGRRERNLETVRWRCGDSQIVALFREQGQPSRATVILSGAGHVYDLRDHRDYGETKSVTLRILPGRATFLAITAAPATPPRLRLQPAGVPRGQVASLRLAGASATGARAVLLTAIQPNGTAADWLRRVVILPPTGAAVPVPLAFNDPPGKWRLRARELYSNRSSEAVMTVR